MQFIFDRFFYISCHELKLLRDNTYHSVLKSLIRKIDKILKSKAMQNCTDIFFVGQLSESQFVQNTMERKIGGERVIHTIKREYIAAVKGAIAIGLRTTNWATPQTIGIQTVGSGFCALSRRGASIYSINCNTTVGWFRICDAKVKQPNQMVIKVYTCDEKEQTDTNKQAKGIGYLNLPKDWKYNEPIGIAYVDGYIGKQFYVVSKDWPDEHDREIQIQWIEHLSW